MCIPLKYNNIHRCFLIICYIVYTAQRLSDVCSCGMYLVALSPRIRPRYDFVNGLCDIFARVVFGRLCSPCIVFVGLFIFHCCCSCLREPHSSINRLNDSRRSYDSFAIVHIVYLLTIASDRLGAYLFFISFATE